LERPAGRLRSCKYSAIGGELVEQRPRNLVTMCDGGRASFIAVIVRHPGNAANSPPPHRCAWLSRASASWACGHRTFTQFTLRAASRTASGLIAISATGVAGAKDQGGAKGGHPAVAGRAAVWHLTGPERAPLSRGVRCSFWHRHCVAASVGHVDGVGPRVHRRRERAAARGDGGGHGVGPPAEPQSGSSWGGASRRAAAGDTVTLRMGRCGLASPGVVDGTPVPGLADMPRHRRLAGGTEPRRAQVTGASAARTSSANSSPGPGNTAVLTRMIAPAAPENGCG
jgi:hypothetical protein